MLFSPTLAFEDSILRADTSSPTKVEQQHIQNQIHEQPTLSWFYPHRA